MNGVKKRIDSLKKFFLRTGKCAVALSGGVDSALVLKVATDTLGPANVIAVTGVSETFPSYDLLSAKKIAKQTGVAHIVIRTRELSDRNFSQNTILRCFHCKSELFRKIKAAARKRGFSAIVDGSNIDDLSDYRPGRKAALSAGVMSPLISARVGKEEVRTISRSLGMPAWDRPQSPCLASRIPFGSPITREKLNKIAVAEKTVKEITGGNVRVRHHGETARIEVDRENIPLLIRKLTPEKIKKIKRLGYKYVTVDAEGFRSGSLNPKKGDYPILHSRNDS